MTHTIEYVKNKPHKNMFDEPFLNSKSSLRAVKRQKFCPSFGFFEETVGSTHKTLRHTLLQKKTSSIECIHRCFFKVKKRLNGRSNCFRLFPIHTMKNRGRLTEKTNSLAYLSKYAYFWSRI